MSPARRNRTILFAAAVLLSQSLAPIMGDLSRVHAAAPKPQPEREKVQVSILPQANGDFACDVYRQLAADYPNDNLFFSPYSITAALSMAAEGARGKTADEIGAALRLPQSARQRGKTAESTPWKLNLVSAELAALQQYLAPPADDSKTNELRKRIAALRAELDAANKQLEEVGFGGRRNAKNRDLRDRAVRLADQLNQLYPLIDSYEFNVANSVWVAKQYPILPQFLDMLSDNYGTGGAFACDFIGRPNEERTRINLWVEKETRGKIRNLLPEGSINSMTALTLINAAYFQGRWSEPFKPENTTPKPFTLADGTMKVVPTMRDHKEQARYGAFEADGTPFDTPAEVTPKENGGYEEATLPGDDGFLILSMPYQGKKLSMVFLAPMKPGGLEAIERPLTGEKLRAWIGTLQMRDVDVYLPKFKFDASYSLSGGGGVLQRLGINRAFVNPRSAPAGEGADFSGISSVEPPELFISFVLHKAFVDVQEKGTEAAAATAIGFEATAAPVQRIRFIPTFRADRPFLFLIRDVETGMILFLGRVMNPQSAQGA